jgi:DNA-3-methyladenine glycosylase II
MTLCYAIISQQLNGKVAGIIMGRLQGLLAPQCLAPAGLLGTPDDVLRGIGLSRHKVTALKDLASKVQRQMIELDTLPTQHDDAIVQCLTQVKGIGRWTAEMFLIFALGRLNVFPIHDLGVRQAMQRVYGYKRLPAPVTMQRHARKWVPYRTIATWYLWRSLETPGLWQGE